MKLDPKMTGALRDAVAILQKRHPEIYEVMDRAARKEITEEEAILEMVAVAQKDPGDLERNLMEALSQVAPDPGEAPPPSGGLFYSGHGTPRLNPLFEAALIERLQFDGDAPELRSGPLPHGSLPAVPVLTEARSSAAIGAMLDTASKRTLEGIRTHERKRLGPLSVESNEDPGSEQLATILKETEGLTNRPTNVEALAWGSAETDLPAYRRGREASPVSVARIPGSQLAAMTDEETRENAWRFRSTTAGRQSAVGTIRAALLKDFEVEGLSVEAGAGAPGEDVEVAASYIWAANLVGPRTSNPSVSLVDLAAKVLYKGLSNRLSDEDALKVTYTLYVTPFNAISSRRVGWVAHLVRSL